MEVQRKYRTFWPRFWAGWIDALVFVPLAAGADWLIQRTVDAPLLLGLWFVLYTFSYDIYSVAFHTKYGQTPGKMAMRIRVLSVSETKLTFRKALLRDAVAILISSTSLIRWFPQMASGDSPYAVNLELNWVDGVSAFGSLIWFIAEFATMLTNAKRRAIHDFIAGSVVVRTETAASSIQAAEA